MNDAKTMPLPCPFCCEHRVMICATHFEGEDREAFAVTCQTQECHGVIFTLGYGLFDSREKAIRAWNTRAAAPSVPVDEPRPIDADTISTLTKQVLWQQQEIEDLKHDLERYMEIASKEAAPSVPVEGRDRIKAAIRDGFSSRGLTARYEIVDAIADAILVALPQPPAAEPVAWLDLRSEPAPNWTKRIVATNPDFVKNNGPENFVSLYASPPAAQTVREATIEECAKIVDQFGEFDGPDAAKMLRSMCATTIAAKLRALAASDSGKDQT